MSALDDLASAAVFHDADAPQRALMLSRLADTELSVALDGEPTAGTDGHSIVLRMFPLDGRQVALACDSEDRLSGFFERPTPYAAMPGRALAAMLRTVGADLLINPGHPSEMLLDAAMLDWLMGALDARPEEAEARLRLMAPAPQAVADLAGPLAARLADLRGLITGAALAGVAGPDGPSAHLLIVAGAPADRQPAIAKALAEALSFLPSQPGGVDITFASAMLPGAALRFDLSEPEKPVHAPKPKGPPILR